MLVDVLDHILERLSARRMSTQDFCATLVTIDADNWQPFGIAPTAGSAAQPVSFDVLTMVLARAADILLEQRFKRANGECQGLGSDLIGGIRTVAGEIALLGPVRLAKGLLFARSEMVWRKMSALGRTFRHMGVEGHAAKASGIRLSMRPNAMPKRMPHHMSKRMSEHMPGCMS